MKLALFVALYVVGAVVSYGAMNANSQYECHNRWPTICNARMVRENRTMAVVVAMIPLAGWFVAAVVTGGYQDGLSYSATPHVTR